MRYFITAILLALLSTPAIADQWVNGYTRSDGTYVQGHYRSSPNSYEYDNYSADGNYNPYTGEEGTRDHEFSTPDYGTDYDSGYDSDYGYDPYD